MIIDHEILAPDVFNDADSESESWHHATKKFKWKIREVIQVKLFKIVAC